jgi:Kef-type K+ transport system membrane component KefB
MENLWIAVIASALILLSSIVSIELGISIAIIEIVAGVIAGNLLGLHTTPWIDFLAGFASIALTFLAGTEVDPDLLREKWKESILIGGLSFLAPFLICLSFAYWVLNWSLPAAQIAGVALSTTSLAVVYAVLVETGLTETYTGKLIMASTFITDFGTALALSLLFIRPGWNLILFILVSILIIVLIPKVSPWFFQRFGERVTEPEIKLIFASLFLMMWIAEMSDSHAVLPAFIFGLAMARFLSNHRSQLRRLRVVAFALLTPFFFLKSGMNVSLTAIAGNLGLLAVFLGLKLFTKLVGVYPLARRFIRNDAWYTTLLMSTGLTFGTISSLYGLNAEIIDQAQFSVLVTTVIGTAIIPTFIAQRFFSPKIELKKEAENV